MNNPFRGWRPKLGLAALLVALITTFAWVRSLHHYDLLSLAVAAKSIQVVESHEGRLYWTRIENPATAPRWNRLSASGIGAVLANPLYLMTAHDAKTSYLFISSGEDFPFDCSSVTTAVFQTQPKRALKFSVWSFSYTTICLPITVMSALLLLWPRSMRTSGRMARTLL